MTFWRPRLIRDTPYPARHPLPERLRMPMPIHWRRVPRREFFNVCPVWKAAPIMPQARSAILARPHKAWWVRPDITNRVAAIIFRFDAPGPSVGGTYEVTGEPLCAVMWPEARGMIVWPDDVSVIRYAALDRLLGLVALGVVHDEMVAMGLGNPDWIRPGTRRLDQGQPQSSAGKAALEG